MKIKNVRRWSQDSLDGDVYHTECGHVFIINAGTPKENEMKYCCFCSHQIEEDLQETTQ